MVDEIVRRRLRNQLISHPIKSTPAEVVGRLAAVQAQDYAGSKWALGLRLKGATDDDVERAVTDGSILRTHLLRPTWHFVTSTDIRWLLMLTAPRVHAANGTMYRRYGLDRAAARKTQAILVKALSGGQALTRDELNQALVRAKITTDTDNKLAYIMMLAELDAVICSGPRRGKQFTYALLDERAPAAKPMSRDDALAELSRRFYASRGPASPHDFAKWSGLTLADARRGLEEVQGALASLTLGKRTLWYSPGRLQPAGPPAHLLSIYDEYVSGYRDRSELAAAQGDGAKLVGMGNALQFIMVLDGRIVGTWRRNVAGGKATVQLAPFRRLAPAIRAAFTDAAGRYGAFLGMPVSLTP